MIVATAGHVDHGKTRLVHALTGVDTDRLAEERRRGLTIELGFAYVQWRRERWGFIDVPGHERFVPNMLSGLATIDLALVVVAADDGPMPQTREHLDILSLLGVSHGVVAITKTDAVAADRVHARQDDVRALLRETPLAEAPILPVSAQTGYGVNALRTALESAGSMRGPQRRGHFRLAVDRSFKLRGTGVVVTGTAVAGCVRAGDTLVRLPGQTRVRVRGLHAADEPARTARAGERVALNVTGIGRDEVQRGDWLTAPPIAQVSERLDVAVRMLGDTPLPRSGTEVYLHHGAAHRQARLVELTSDLDDDGARHVGLNLRAPVHALHGDRFVLRDASAQHTLGGGRILEPFPPRRGRRRPSHQRWLAALQGTDTRGIAKALLHERPLGLPLTMLTTRLNLEETELAALLDLPATLHHIEGDQDLLVDATAWSRFSDALLDAVERWHAANPQLIGIRVDQLRALVEPSAPEARLRAALRQLIAANALVQANTWFRRPGHMPELIGSDLALWARAQPLLAAAPTKPPVVHNLASELALSAQALTALLARAAHVGHVLKIASNRFMLPEGVRTLAETANAVAAESPHGRFDVRAFRDRSGIGRNLAVDVLEYFDRMGLTRRIDDVRVVVRNANELFGG